MPTATRALGSPPPPPQIDDGAPAAQGRLAVDGDVQVPLLEQARADHVGERDRVVDRGAAEGVDAVVERPVEAEKVGDDGADSPRGAQPRLVLAGEQRLVGHVEADHRHVEAAREHPLRRLGIGPDVELGGRGDVALRDRATHEHDALGPRVRVAGEEQRDVGQRAGGDEGRAVEARGQEVDGVLVHRRARGRRQVGAVQPRLAVHGGREPRGADERPVRPGRNRNVAAAGQLQHAQRVGGRLVERLVARHRGDAEQLDLGAGEREEQGDRVVVTGIAVEQDRGRHAPEYLPGGADRVDLAGGRQRRLRARHARRRSRRRRRRGAAPPATGGLRGARRPGTP